MKQRRTLLLSMATVLMLALASAGPALRAQEATPVTAPAHEGEARAAEPRGEGHEGAAKEEGEHHADVTLFGKVLDTKAKFGVQVFNFAIFAAILVLLLRTALATAFKARTKELEDKLSQAETDRTQAAAQIQELDSRMAGLQQELAGIMAKAETDAEAEKARILESAKAESAQILAQTQAEITFQKRQAEDELRALVSTLAIEGATRRLESQLQGEAAGPVLDHAIEQVGGAK